MKCDQDERKGKQRGKYGKGARIAWDGGRVEEEGKYKRVQRSTQEEQTTTVLLYLRRLSVWLH